MTWNARKLEKALTTGGLKPDRIVPAASGGLDAYLFGPSHTGRFAAVTVDADDERATVLLSDRRIGWCNAEEFDLSDEFELDDVRTSVWNFLYGGLR